MEPTRDAVVQGHWRLQVISIILVQLEQQQVVQSRPMGGEGVGGGGGGGLETLVLWGILVSLKMISQDNSPYSEGQPLLYGMHVSLLLSSSSQNISIY